MYWYSPFNLSKDLNIKLKNNGFIKLNKSELASENNYLVLYQDPEQVFKNSLHFKDSINIFSIFEGYKEVLTLRELNLYIINAFQLLKIDDNYLQKIAKSLNMIEDNYFQKDFKLTNKNNISNYLAHNLNEFKPEIYNLYLDCELKSSLMGREPDLDYLRRIKNNCNLNNSFDEIRTLMQEGGKLKKSITEIKEHNDKLSNLNNKDMDKIKILENKEKDFETKNKNLLINLKDLERNQIHQISQKDNFIKELNEKNHNLLDQISQKDNFIKELNEKNRNLLKNINNEMKQLILQNSVYKEQLINIESKNNKLETINNDIQNDLNSINTEKDNMLLEFQNVQEELEKYFFLIAEIKKLKDFHIREIQRSQLIMGRLLKHSNQMTFDTYFSDKKKNFNIKNFLPFKKN